MDLHTNAGAHSVLNRSFTHHAASFQRTHTEAPAAWGPTHHISWGSMNLGAGFTLFIRHY